MAALSRVLAAVVICLSSFLGSAKCHGNNLRVTGKVEGDYEEEICEVHAVSSSDPKCSSLFPDTIKNAMIFLTKNNGVAESICYANSPFFATEKSLENCPKILLDMGILPPGADVLGGKVICQEQWFSVGLGVQHQAPLAHNWVHSTAVLTASVSFVF